MGYGAHCVWPQKGMKTGLSGGILGTAADDGDRWRSGIAKPFVNVVRNAFWVQKSEAPARPGTQHNGDLSPDKRTLWLRPWSGKPVKERPIFFFSVLRLAAGDDR